MITMSERIALIRKRYDLTAEELEKAADVPEGTVAAWEAGEKEPSFQTIKKIVKNLGIPEYLFFVEDHDVYNCLQNFHSRLSLLRKQNNASLKEISYATKLSTTNLKKWEKANSDNYPKIHDAIIIADFYGVSLDYLFCLSDDPRPRYIVTKPINGLSAHIAERILSLPEIVLDEILELCDTIKKIG